MAINAITLIQAIWKGHVTRKRFQETKSKLVYVDDDDYDYVQVDEREFALDALNLKDFIKSNHNFCVNKSLLESNKISCDDVSEVKINLCAPITCTPPITSDCKTNPYRSWSTEALKFTNFEISGTQRPNSPCISHSSVSKT